MSDIDDTLWKHLVEHHGADRARVRSTTAPRRSRRPVAAGIVATGLAAAAVATVVVIGPGTAPTGASSPHASRHPAPAVSAGPATAHDAGYIIERVKAKTADDDGAIVHWIGYSSGDATSDGSLVHLGEKLTDGYAYTASHGFASVQRTVDYRAGRRVSGVLTRVSPDGRTQWSSVVDYTNHTYVARRFAISGGAGPALTPTSPAQVRRALQTGEVTRQGTASIGGRPAITLLVRVKPSKRPALILYVDAQTYEPLRVLSRESDGETGLFVGNWIPPTRADMAKVLHSLVPAGYRKVSARDLAGEQ